MENIKTIALVAHDNQKRDLGEWVDNPFGCELLSFMMG